jgi:integrase
MATIFQRGRSWYLNISQNGKRTVRSLGTDERLAGLRLAEVQINIERGKAGFPQIEEKTLSQLLDEFILANSAGKAPKTVVRYRGMAAHALAFFGPDARVDGAGLRRYIAHRQEQGVRSKTINNELIFLRTVHGARGTHPFRGVSNLPVRDSKDVRFLTADEAARLLAACSSGINREGWPDLADYVAAYLYTGMRLGELGAVTWSDVGAGGIRVTNLKTFGRRRGDKYRLVPVHPALAPILARRRKASPALPCPFPARQQNSTLRAIVRAADRAGLAPGVGVHTLRHTFAAHLVQRGVSLYVVSKLLGHSSQETTRIYAHLSVGSLESAVGLLSFQALA